MLSKSRLLAWILLLGLIPISTAASNFVFYSLLLITFFGLFLQADKNVRQLFLCQPFIAFFGLCLIILVSGVIGESQLSTFLIGSLKYVELFAIGLFALSVTDNPELKKYCIWSFSIAMIITLLISYLIFFNVSFFSAELMRGLLNKMGDSANPTVFKMHITHNFFMAFAALLWAYFMVYFWQAQRILAIFFTLLCLFSLANIFFMVQGRIGYVVVFSAFIYFFVNRYKGKGMLIGTISLCIASLLLYYFSNNFHARVYAGISEFLAWNSKIPSSTSIGLRLEFIYQSLQVVREHLFFGVGIGNFGPAYGTQVLNSEMVASVNPHNQYILFLVETGLVGLGAFLYLNVVCWKCAGELSLFWKHATRVVLLSYGVANLFNSFLFDFSESLFFSAFMALAFSELVQEKNEVNSVT